MQVRVLGPTQLDRGGHLVEVGAPKQRALLAALALHRGRVVSTDALADLVWTSSPPGSVQIGLQAYVSGLRRVLEPDRRPGEPSVLLATAGTGYQLRMDASQLDSEAFAAEVAAVHPRLAAPGLAQLLRPSVDPAEAERSIADLDRVLAWWRGVPYADLGEADEAKPERARLTELRTVAEEDRFVALLRLDRAATLAAELEAATSTHPLRERLWVLRALALARSGRQADALAVVAEIGRLLDDELGIEPGPELRELQLLLLRQDPALQRRDPVRSRSVLDHVDDHQVPREAPRSSAVDPTALIGRDAELDVLLGLLADSRAGRAHFAALVGEPGIGKSRLAAELITRSEAGPSARVLQARCSSDDGAPPLWPWRTLLQQLDRPMPQPAGTTDAPDFALWTLLIEEIVTAARAAPTLLLLDDLHWADPATLRALRLLVEAAEDVSLLVVLTWRPQPPPTDQLADLIESLARRGLTELRLAGLNTHAAASLVASLLDAEPSPVQAETLRSRTDGNPFFLLSYARLARNGDLASLISGPEPPAAVSDVLSRRLDRLPGPTRDLLGDASVLGRRFDLRLLAAMAGLDDLDTLDRLDPALDAGLVREDGPDVFLFAHALIRDTAYTRQAASRRARKHARAAEVIQRDGADVRGFETELARHWAAAGPQYAEQAWRAAARAAQRAAEAYGYEEAVGLLGLALERQQELTDRGAELDLRERYALLIQLAESCRWAGRWAPMVGAVEAAIDVARDLAEPRLMAEAAVRPSVGAVWRTGSHGLVEPRIVPALRECLQLLPAADDPLRARVMVALANELYYGATFGERVALVDEALAMVERLDDDQLRAEANLIAFAALWRPDTAARRRALAEQAAAAADRLGAEHARTTARIYLAAAQSELGDIEAMWATVTATLADAERLGLLFPAVVLDSLALPWLAMGLRFDEAEESLDEITRLDDQLALPGGRATAASALISTRRWQHRWDDLLPVLHQLGSGPIPLTAVVASVLLRAGRRDEAADLLARSPITLDTDDWVSMLSWCCAAEVALEFDDHQLAAASYAKLSPYAGQVATAGGNGALGPVDAFLALAARTVGETDSAREHAERSLALMQRWRIPAATDWLTQLRQRFDF